MAWLKTFVASLSVTFKLGTFSLHSSFMLASDPPKTAFRFSLKLAFAPTLVRRLSARVSVFESFPPQPIPIFFSLVTSKVPSSLQLAVLVALPQGF
jgi:hypothetical protein